MNRERLMGANLTPIFTLLSPLSREICAYSIKIPAKFAKKYLAWLQQRGLNAQNRLFGRACF